MPFRVGRLKTGTPPRIDGRTIDYSDLVVQHGDEPCPVFSFLGLRADHPRQVPCHITATNERTHEIIRAGSDRSPMFTGVIEGVGPRYCPSVEDKVVRFAERDLAPDLHRARGARHARGISERHLDQPAVRRAGRIRAHSIRGFEQRAHHASRLCHRIRLLRSARPARHAGDQAPAGPVFRRPDQWHDRLRGSRGAGPRRGHQRRRSRAGREPWCPGAARPTSAC